MKAVMARLIMLPLVVAFLVLPWVWFARARRAASDARRRGHASPLHAFDLAVPAMLGTGMLSVAAAAWLDPNRGDGWLRPTLALAVGVVLLVLGWAALRTRRGPDVRAGTTQLLLVAGVGLAAVAAWLYVLLANDQPIDGLASVAGAGALLSVALGMRLRARVV
jgi:hypothetical protein